MAKKLDNKETVSAEELLISNMLTQEALVNLLDEKGILKKENLLKEVQRLKQKHGI